MSASRMAQASPVPAQTILGSVAATARAPMAETGWLSKMGFHFWPPSSLFHIPPEAAPAYQVLGSPGAPATEATRLPRCGPTKRKLSSSALGGPLALSLAASSPSARAADRPITTAAMAAAAPIFQTTGTSSRDVKDHTNENR